MPEFDVEAFVAKLERMGLKLTSVPLADGKVRINRWRMMNAGEHTQQIQDLWMSQVGDDQARIDPLGASLARVAPPATANRISFAAAAPPAAVASQKSVTPQATATPASPLSPP